MWLRGPRIWSNPNDVEAARKLLWRVIDLGVNFLDTADVYGPGVSERLLADSLHPYPGDLVIATKGGLAGPGRGRWQPDCRPEHLKGACEASLRRLNVPRIDLYQLHTVDPKVPIEDSVGALQDLQREGKIRHIGLSNVRLEHLRRAKMIAPIVSVQNRYSLADRTSDDVLAVCEQERIAFLPWAPLAKGQLARPGNPLEEIAAAHGATPAQIALAWLLHRSPVMLPIPGTASILHLEENVAAAQIKVGAEDLRRIDVIGAA